MKIIAINGSPQPNGTTVTLLERAMKGARSRGAETKRVDLYRLNYKGCVSCFYCKRKDKPHGTCAVRDDLSPILTELKEADALLLGTPIYFDNITSGTVAFLERFLFSNYIWRGDSRLSPARSYTFPPSCTARVGSAPHCLSHTSSAGSVSDLLGIAANAAPTCAFGHKIRTAPSGSPASPPQWL